MDDNHKNGCMVKNFIIFYLKVLAETVSKRKASKY